MVFQIINLVVLVVSVAHLSYTVGKRDGMYIVIEKYAENEQKFREIFYDFLNENYERKDK